MSLHVHTTIVRGYIAKMHTNITPGIGVSGHNCQTSRITCTQDKLQSGQLLRYSHHCHSRVQSLQLRLSMLPFFFIPLIFHRYPARRTDTVLLYLLLQQL